MPAARFFRGLALGALAGVGGWALLLAILAGRPFAEHQTLNDGYVYKLERAARQPGPRLLIAAGSNAHFGINAELLSRTTGRPAYNLGLNAGMGLDFMLDTVRAAARRGDVVLLPLEYDIYQDTERPTSLRFEFHWATDPRWILERPAGLRWAYLATPTLWQLLQGVERASRTTPSQSESWIGPHGDLKAAILKFPPPRPPATTSVNDAIGAYFARSITPFCRSRALAFASSCRAAGIQVVATFPNVAAHPSYRVPEGRCVVGAVRALWREAGVPLVGTPAEAMLPPAAMYDTYYHPAPTARDARTRALAPHLRPWVPLASRPTPGLQP